MISCLADYANEIIEGLEDPDEKKEETPEQQTEEKSQEPANKES